MRVVALLSAIVDAISHQIIEGFAIRSCIGWFPCEDYAFRADREGR